MRTLVTVGLVALGATLVMAPLAEGHSLTKKKAQAALKPVVTEITPQVAPLIAAKLPGATISKSQPGPCAISKSKHRAACVIRFSIQGASTGETECVLDALVKFRSKRSKELEVEVGSVLVCAFPVELPG